MKDHQFLHSFWSFNQEYLLTHESDFLLDWTSLESNFEDLISKKRRLKALGQNVDSPTKENDKAEKVYILEPQKVQNYYVAITKLGMSIETAQQKIADLTLTHDQVYQLIRCFPPDEETQQLLKWKGDENQLTKEERQLCKIVKIPRGKIRVRCLMEKYDFESDFLEFYARLGKYHEPFVVFQKDKCFQLFLGTFLRVTNYMNTGTKRAEASGWPLDTMKSFENIKSGLNKN